VFNIKKAWEMARNSLSLFEKSMDILGEACRAVHKNVEPLVSSDDDIHVVVSYSDKSYECNNMEHLLDFCMSIDKKEMSADDFNEKWETAKNLFFPNF
jgi:hypothetical protein